VHYTTIGDVVKSNVGAIAGGVVGGVVLIIALVVVSILIVIFVVMLSHQKEKPNGNTSSIIVSINVM
jgi:chromate transport protein ChrA